MSRMGMTINKCTQLLSGPRIPVVDDLLESPNSFCVQLACLDAEQQYALMAQSFVEKKQVQGIEYAYAIKRDMHTHWITENGDKMIEGDLSVQEKHMDTEAMLVRSKAPHLMNVLLDAVTSVDIAGQLKEVVATYLWAHVLFPHHKFFLVDNQSDGCITVPRASEEAVSAAPIMPFFPIWKQQMLDKCRDNRDTLMTHTTIVELNQQFYLCAFNNIFLEEAEKCGVLAKDAPNEWCRRFKCLFPSAPAWERSMMHPWMITSHLFKTDFNKCTNCDSRDVHACKDCHWARLCGTCMQHDETECKMLKMLRDKMTV